MIAYVQRLFAYDDWSTDATRGGIAVRPVASIGYLHFRIRRVRAGVDKIVVAPVFASVKAKCHRLIGRAAGGCVTTGDLKVPRHPLL